MGTNTPGPGIQHNGRAEKIQNQLRGHCSHRMLAPTKEGAGNGFKKEKKMQAIHIGWKWKYIFTKLCGVAKSLARGPAAE